MKHNPVETAYFANRPYAGATSPEKNACLLEWWSAAVLTLHYRNEPVDQALLEIAKKAGIVPLGMTFDTGDLVAFVENYENKVRAASTKSALRPTTSAGRKAYTRRSVA